MNGAPSRTGCVAKDKKWVPPFALLTVALPPNYSRLVNKVTGYILRTVPVCTCGRIRSRANYCCATINTPGTRRYSTFRCCSQIISVTVALLSIRTRLPAKPLRTTIRHAVLHTQPDCSPDGADVLKAIAPYRLTLDKNVSRPLASGSLVYTSHRNNPLQNRTRKL